MKMQCQNHWYRLELNERRSFSALDDITVRVNCERVATEIVTDEYDGQTKDVCPECKRSIELGNWLRSPEGQAALAELDWEEND